MKSKVSWTIGFSLALVAAAALIHYAQWSKESLKGGAENLIALVFKGDAEGLINYMEQDELKLGGVNRESIDELLTLVRRRLQGFAPNGGIKEFPGGLSNRLVAHQELIHSDGRKAYLTFSMWETPEGNKTMGLCEELVRAAASSVRPKGSPIQGVEAFRVSLKAWDVLMPELEKLKLKGIATPKGFKTWREIRETKARTLSEGEADSKARAARTSRLVLGR